MIDVDTADYCWTIVVGSPDITITDPTHQLAQGLPSTYNLANNAATYYQLRITDSEPHVVAVNGDGYKAIVTKNLGSGKFTWFINSPYQGYWENPADYNYLKTFLDNAIKSCLGSPNRSVGGEIASINSLALMAPWIALTIVAITLSFTLSKKRLSIH